MSPRALIVTDRARAAPARDLELCVVTACHDLLCALPVRWVVERTYAWQGRYRGLSKDYEHTPESSETVVRIAAIHHLLQRLRPKRKARSQRFRFKRRRKRAA